MRLCALILAFVLAAILLPATPAVALHGTDIVLSSSPSVLSARLHLFKWEDRKDAGKSYDVKGLDGARGVITFYQRAINAGGYPRGAVLQTWVYEFDEAGFNTGAATDADSVSAVFTETGKCAVRPIR